MLDAILLGEHRRCDDLSVKRSAQRFTADYSAYGCFALFFRRLRSLPAVLFDAVCDTESRKTLTLYRKRFM